MFFKRTECLSSLAVLGTTEPLLELSSEGVVNAVALQPDFSLDFLPAVEIGIWARG